MWPTIQTVFIKLLEIIQKALFFECRLDMKQKCRPELCPFHLAGQTQTESCPRLIFLNSTRWIFFFFFLSDSRLHPFIWNQPQGSEFRSSPTDSFTPQFNHKTLVYTRVYTVHSLKGKYQHCASQQLYSTPHLEDEGRGDSLVAVVIVYNIFKGITYQKLTLFQQSYIKRYILAL